MATRIKLMKLIQEVRGFAEFGRAIQAPKPPAYFLMRLRSHAGRGPAPRRRLTVQINLNDHLDFPQPVKITHVKAPQAASPAHPTA